MSDTKKAGIIGFLIVVSGEQPYCRETMNKKTFTSVVVIVVALLAFGYFAGWFGGGEMPENGTSTPEDVLSPRGDNPEQPGDTDFDDEDNDDDQQDEDDESEEETTQDDGEETIGQSVNGNAITAYHYGSGDTELLLVGGIHGGYSWNTSLLSYELMDWLESNPDVIPENVTVTVIPVLNPDGLSEVVGTASASFSAADVPSMQETIPGRFNANDVDLNRNFDCNWQSEGTWQNRTVDAGSSAFSEPEAQALRDYVRSNEPTATVVYYSAAGGVYTSSCNGEVTQASQSLMNTYAQASGYPAEGEFTAYEVSGDAVDWMAKEGFTGISVLLETHSSSEYSQNQAALEAMLESYAN